MKLKYYVYNTCLNHFNLVSEDEVKKKISSSNNKFCKLDPVPTNILKSCLDILLPFITYLINLSLSTGTFPKCWKSALVIPLIKKPNLETEYSNYRPVSNLPFFEKL